MDDFRKFATKHLGMNSMVLDDVIKSQGYLNPYILEERHPAPYCSSPNAW